MLRVSVCYNDKIYKGKKLFLAISTTKLIKKSRFQIITGKGIEGVVGICGMRITVDQRLYVIAKRHITRNLQKNWLTSRQTLDWLTDVAASCRPIILDKKHLRLEKEEIKHNTTIGK